MQLDQIQLKKNYPNMHHQELTQHLTKLNKSGYTHPNPN